MFRTKRNVVTVEDGSKTITSALLGGQPEIDAYLLGQHSRAGDMIRVDVGVDHSDQPPLTFPKQLRIDGDIERGIDDDCLGLGFNDVGKTTLSSPPDLDKRAT